MSANCELLINYIQNEPTIWDTCLNATEEEKELSWSKVSDALGCKNGKFYS